MVKFGGRIGVEDCLLAVPVALGDVSNVQNARCVTTTLDLEAYSARSVNHSYYVIDTPNHFYLPIRAQPSCKIRVKLISFYVLHENTV